LIASVLLRSDVATVEDRLEAVSLKSSSRLPSLLRGARTSCAIVEASP
jgi:hypothetical protein